MPADLAVVAEGLVKTYGSTRALDGLDLQVETGTVLGVLGPNGAGKTTAVRILTTLLQPDEGSATVAGFDVATQAAQLRAHIGLAGQYAAVNENLTGRENVEAFARLYHQRKEQARARTQELLERFDLTDAADRPAKTYSGGMRRRLDLAASLVVDPPVLFLDEPTTGLDPRSRLGLWELIEDLVREGTTLLLTTQYLDEADRLADRIVVIDGGRAIATGTADELKDRVGGDRVEVQLPEVADLAVASRVVQPHLTGEVVVDEARRRLSGPVAGATVLAAVVRDLDAAGLEIHDLALRRPTLDDVFLRLTGRAAEEQASADVNGGAPGDGTGLRRDARTADAGTSAATSGGRRR